MKLLRKKLPAWVLIFIFLFSISLPAGAGANPLDQSIPNPGTNAEFRDVGVNNVNAAFIKYLTNRGLVKGFPDGTFRPERGITRAELVVLLSKILGVTGGTEEKKFKDVSTHWAAASIAVMSKAGLISGYPDGTFRPDRIVTRAEGVSLLLRLNQEPDAQIQLPQLEDLDNGHWAAQHVAVGLDSEMVRTINKTHFSPNGPFFRGDLARALSVLLVKDHDLSREYLPNQLKLLKGELSVTSDDGVVTNRVKDGFTVKPGDRITTGEKGVAELLFPDGSGILIKENTELIVNEFTGRSYIKPDASEGVAVEWLALELKTGRIFGTLATSWNSSQAQTETPTENQTGTVTASRIRNNAENDPSRFLIHTAKANTGKAKPNTGKVKSNTGKVKSNTGSAVPWWKTYSNKRVRVQVDMPWGVAAVRGTFWENIVVPGKYNKTTVLIGEAEVLSGGTSVKLEAGQKSDISSSDSSPAPAAAMDDTDKKEWLEVKEWAETRAGEIHENQEGMVSISVAEPTPLTPPPVENQNTVVTKISQAYDNIASGPVSGGQTGGGGGGTPDTAAPVLTSTSPTSGGSGVSANPLIEINFNENVAAGAAYAGIDVRYGINSIPISKNISGSKLTITPTGQLLYSSLYTVTIPAQAVQDSAGNSFQGGYTFSFTTGGLVSVSSTTPTTNAQKVALNTQVTVTFNQTIQQGTESAFGNITLTDGGTPLTITKSISGSTLTITPSGGLDYSTTYTVTIPALAVKNTAGNGLGSNYSFSFTTRELMAFQTAVNYAVGTSPKGITAGDFDSANSVDLAVIYDSLQEVSILQGQGDGTFVAGAVYSLSQTPNKIASGDFNGDNTTDLAFMYMTSLDNISILSGDGNGGFVAGTVYTAGDSLTAMVVNDFNVDGNSDLAVTNYYFNGSDWVRAVWILAGSPEGTFTMSEVYTTADSLDSITAHDFNGDGFPDLAVGSNSVDSTITILLNNGNGTFKPQSSITIGRQLKSMATGYFDSGTNIDIAALHFAHDNNITTLFGQGNGTTVAGSVYSAASYPNGIAAADLNKDNKYDIAVTSSSGIEIFLGNGDGTFQDPPVNLTAGSSPQGIIAIDVNGDSVKDLVIVNYGSDNISILLNDT